MFESLNEKQLVQEMMALGIKINSVSDLLYLNVRDKAAIPVLAKHLQQTNDEAVKHFFARCLGVYGWSEASKVLLAEFYHTHDKDYKWTIGNSLCIIQDQEILEDLLEIAVEPRHGYARQMIVYSLARYKDARVKEVLLALLQDEEVVAHAIQAWGRIQDPTSITYLEPFLEHPKFFVRTAAKKAITKLNKLKLQELKDLDIYK